MQRKLDEARAERHARKGRRGASRAEGPPADAAAPSTSGRKPAYGKAGGAGRVKGVGYAGSGLKGVGSVGLGSGKKGFGKAGSARPGAGVPAGGRATAGFQRATRGTGGKFAGVGRGKAAGADRESGAPERGRRSSVQKRARFQSFK